MQTITDKLRIISILIKRIDSYTIRIRSAFFAFFGNIFIRHAWHKVLSAHAWKVYIYKRLPCCLHPWGTIVHQTFWRDCSNCFFHPICRLHSLVYVLKCCTKLIRKLCFQTFPMPWHCTPERTKRKHCKPKINTFNFVSKCFKTKVVEISNKS